MLSAEALKLSNELQRKMMAFCSHIAQDYTWPLFSITVGLALHHGADQLLWSRDGVNDASDETA